MAHAKDFRNYPPELSKLAEAFASGKGKVQYVTTRNRAEYDRAVFYAFRAAVKKAEIAGDHEAAMIMMGLNGARFLISPTRGKESTNEDTVKVEILSWTTLGEHPLAQALRALDDREEMQESSTMQ